MTLQTSERTPRSSGVRAGQSPKMRRRRSQRRFRNSPRGQARMNKRQAHCRARGEGRAVEAKTHGVILGQSTAPITYVKVKTLKKLARHIVEVTGGNAQRVRQMVTDLAGVKLPQGDVRLRADARRKMRQLVRDAYFAETGEVLPL